jgi:glycosyltransferase involved in cell wall biosynthesis
MTSTPGSLQRIIFINRFFYPDPSATSQILSNLAFALAEAGFAVTAITSQRSTSANVSLPPAETIEGVEIFRVTTVNSCQNSLIGRAIEYLQFYAAATLMLFSKVGRGDILVAKTDPALISVLAAIVAHLRCAKLVNWLQDLYLEVAHKLGVPLLHGPVGWILRWARDCALRSAHVNVAIGNGMARLLRERGVAANQIEIIENWVDDSEIQPLSSVDNRFLKKVAQQGEFIVGYSGNLGRAHEFETLLGAARLLADREDILYPLRRGRALHPCPQKQGRSRKSREALSVFVDAAFTGAKVLVARPSSSLDLAAAGTRRAHRPEQILWDFGGRALDNCNYGEDG